VSLWIYTVLLVAVSAGLSAVLIVLLRPILVQYTLARPNARSSHNVPTPQGAGLAVVGASLACSIVGWQLMAAPPGAPPPYAISLVLAVLGLAAVGFIDDIAPLPPLVRLIVQTAACLGLLLALPDGARALPFLPYPLEALIQLVGLVWFVNLVNFMDGIDGMTVAGVVPILAGISVFAAWPELVQGTAALTELIVALALIGALIGFAPFNHHVAKVFLGDVGSLAIGGVAGWLLLSLACRGQLIAALILALYYLSDTTTTLFLRWRRGVRLSDAHREHFYQRAIARGMSVPQVISRVWALNGALMLLALTAGVLDRIWLQIVCLTIAGWLTFSTLRYFRGQSSGSAP
jgi:UDP-N-acetylmuramyl pentapeptide phosphotransferase/UDP-N-acetylglucosamine-1-phosphate transferase